MATRNLFLPAAIAAGLFVAATPLAISSAFSMPAPELRAPALSLIDLTQATAGTDQRIELAQADRRNRRRTRSGAAAGAAAGAGAGSAAAAQSGIPGRYAVLRADNRDAGCLLSLNRNGRALVGPGCADHGIQIFDPVRWSYSRGQITLRARKGHRISFARQPDGSWQRAPAAKTALGLRKY